MTLLFYFALEYAIKSFQVNQNGLKLKGTHQLMFYVDYVNITDESMHIIKKKTEAFLVAVKTKYMIMSLDQNTGRSQYIKTDNSSFERVDEF